MVTQDPPRIARRRRSTTETAWQHLNSGPPVICTGTEHQSVRTVIRP